MWRIESRRTEIRIGVAAEPIAITTAESSRDSIDPTNASPLASSTRQSPPPAGGSPVGERSGNESLAVEIEDGRHRIRLGSGRCRRVNVRPCPDGQKNSSSESEYQPGAIARRGQDRRSGRHGNTKRDRQNACYSSAEVAG
jgi:hypothetical protein